MRQKETKTTKQKQSAEKTGNTDKNIWVNQQQKERIIKLTCESSTGKRDWRVWRKREKRLHRACENGQGNRSGVAQMSIRDKGWGYIVCAGMKQVSSAGDGNGNDVSRSFSASEEAGNFRLAKFAWRRNVLWLRCFFFWSFARLCFWPRQKKTRRVV